MNPTEKQKLLEEIFEKVVPLTTSQIADLDRITRVDSLPSGSLFVRVGEKSERIAIVVSGLLRAYYLEENGKLLIRKFYQKGDIVGAFAATLAEEPAHVTVDALDDSTLLTFPYSKFVSLRERDLFWERVNRILLERNYVQREKRAFELLAFDAKKRYQLFRDEYGEIGSKISKTDIASYLGISPVSLSRILHR